MTHPENVSLQVLEPCQFCTSTKVAIVDCPIQFKPGRKRDFWVACRACGASGPVAGSVEAAAQWWNLGKPEEKESACPE